MEDGRGVGRKGWAGLDSLGVYSSRVEGWCEVPFAIAGFLLPGHLIRRLCEPHKSFAEVLHPRVRIVLWSIIVLWSGVCMWTEASRTNGDHATSSVCHIQMPKKKLGGEGVTYREELANGGVLNSLPEQVFFVEEEDLHS